MSSKRRKKIKNRRKKRIERGKNVPFSIANCPKKLKGISYRYSYKINVHNCCFNEAEFYNDRYRAGHITNSFMRDCSIKNVDYISINFKKTSFKNTKLMNVLFYGCDLSYCDFSGAVLDDVLFINCKIKNTIGNVKNNTTKKKELTNDLRSACLRLKNNKKLERYNILITKDNRVNELLISILMDKWKDEELIKAFNKFVSSTKDQFYSFFSYVNNISLFYKA